MDAFAQHLDTARPHQLHSQNPKREGQLRYQYEDTGETVRVPNVWYNQTGQMRVAALRWEAAELREKAERTEKFPDTRLSLAARKQQAARIRARADELLLDADRLAALPEPVRPVTVRGPH